MAKKEKKISPWVVISISIASILMAYLLSYTNTLNSIELKLLDMRFGLIEAKDLSENPIVIVKIDDQSDETVRHRWPWPRSYYAQVIKNLNAAGAKAVGIDVILDKPNQGDPEGDDELSQVLQEYDNVVLVGKIVRDGMKNEIITPYEKFTNNNNSWGLVSVENDIDGFYRRYLVTTHYNDSLFNSFAAELYKIYTDQPQMEISESNDYYTLGDLKIPKFSASSMLINFHGPANTFPGYSFDYVVDSEDFDLRDDYDSDLFDDPGDPELGIPPGLMYSGQLKDKIILIGATMFELHDNFPTPYMIVKDGSGSEKSIEMPGVELHANALLTMLNRDFITQPSTTLVIIIVLLAVLLTFVITRFLPTLWSTIATLCLIVFYVLIAVFTFTETKFLLEIVNPVLIIAFSYVGHTLYHYLQTQQEKRVLRGAFAHYVPEKVVQQIINNPDTLKLGGEEREVTVMFSDVAGFTTISEKLTPAELVLLLNEYLTAMTNIVLENNGIIDKYEGDAIMAEFGMPVPSENHPHAACRTALQMQKKLVTMREKWRSEGRPELVARVGINTGFVIVGNMGSQTVFDYTVMGDAVNLGARLEGANKMYETYIMISETTNGYVKDSFHTRPLDLIRVKGKNKPVEVFELIAEKNEPLDENHLKMIQLYNNGVNYYRTREWREAIESFDACLQLNPKDHPSKLYRKRCLEFKINDPGPNWDGVFTMTTK
jgi:adenylate cyclase